MNPVYQNIQITEIPKDTLFEGYYWYSNKQSPELIMGEAIQQCWFTELPFVIEANFYARTEQISIQIRHLDGAYHVAKIDLSQLAEGNYDKLTYIGHDIGKRKFDIIEAWELQSDDLLEGMETLVPTWTAFAGFTTIKEK